ncbi:hypothetical protein SLS60_008839 [Paraconiothyrium brasiliense]|uniref:Peptidase S8/S53 domain-containing protein n=1 Tax=Paraconiothyrium brasiliense TaxID=300254 RepID=A0ABR3QYM9_9PLEO
MSSTSEPTKSGGSSIASASQDSSSEGSTAFSSSETATNEEQPTSTLQTSDSSNSTSTSSEPSSETASSYASQTQSQFSSGQESVTSAEAPTQTQFVVTTVTASDGSSGLVTFTTTVEATPAPGGSGETTPLGGPSRTDSASPSQTSSSFAGFPPPYIFDAVIDGQNYHLPAPNEPPMTIILAGGTLAELSNDQVRIGDEIVPMAAFTGTKSINQGGHKYELGKTVGKSTEPPKPSKNGGKGHGGIGGLLGSLAKAGKGAVDGVSKARNDVFNMASSGATAGGGAVAGTLTNAGNEVNSLVSSINGIQQSLPTGKLTETGLKTVLDAQNLGREASNWLTSTASLVKDLPDDMKEQVFDNIKDFAKEGGQLQKAESALEAFKDFPWESELPQSQMPSATQDPSASATNQPSGTSMPTDTASRQTSEDQTTTDASSESMKSSITASTTSAQNTTSLQSTQSTSITSASNTTSATSTSSTGPTPTEATKYFIVTREGTSLDDFKKFIENVDGGFGISHASEYVPHQTYLTVLKPAVADNLQSNYSFIRWVNPFVVTKGYLEAADEEYHAVDRDGVSYLGSDRLSTQLQGFPGDRTAALFPLAFLPPDPNASSWKKMISSPPLSQIPKPPSQDPDYVADDSLGKGVTIYVIDDGFDINLDDLSGRGRHVDSFMVPKEEVAPSGYLEEQRKIFSQAEILDQKLENGLHGTKMAIIVAGAVNGVARRADLYLVKAKGQYRKEPTSSVVNMGYTAPAISTALFELVMG